MNSKQFDHAQEGPAKLKPAVHSFLPERGWPQPHCSRMSPPQPRLRRNVGPTVVLFIRLQVLGTANSECSRCRASVSVSKT